MASLFFTILILPVWAAYNHNGDTDSVNFRTAYPYMVGTKLDSCTLCHKGGNYTDPSTSKTTTLGSCQYCHAITGYGSDPTQFINTLNPYGRDYLNNGRNQAALKAIESLDSDGDGFSNIAEINSKPLPTYPGDPNDNPNKVVASYRIYNKSQLQAMPQHSQFLLMNTTKSGDYYATYSGVIMQDLLKTAGITANATQITVYAADGFSQRHPLEDSSSNVGKTYAPYVNGTYPAATYYYDPQADKANGGWCDYSSPGNAGRKNGDPIAVNGGLRLILALQIDGKDLVPGYLDATNKLASGTEGPFRVVPPQKIVGPPDQASTATNQNVIWPYDSNADHNAGLSSKSVTVIKVEPLPAGTTDINYLEAGFNYVDQGKIVIYGALQGPTLVSPADGTTNVPRTGAVLTWTKTEDTVPSEPITYTVQLSKDKVTWTTSTTKVASADRLSGTFFAGSSKYFLFFGIIGMFGVGVPRRTRKFLGIFLLITVTGAVISSCGGGGGGTSTGGTSSTVSAAIPQSLDANTTYYWRVTGDGPNSHLISGVSSFTTGIMWK